jgi:hypothetical protein
MQLGISSRVGAGLWRCLAELVFQQADQVQPAAEPCDLPGAGGELADWLVVWPAFEMDRDLGHGRPGWLGPLLLAVCGVAADGRTGGGP